MLDADLAAAFDRIDHDRGTVLLEGQELAGVMDERGVGRAAAHRGDARVIGESVAIHSEQSAPRRSVGLSSLIL